MCYVDHHDRAYQWAAGRKIETHPRTGAAQIIEIRELVREIEVPQYEYVDSSSESPSSTSCALDGITEQQLLDYGVPPEWVSDVLGANEDELLHLTDHLPAEAAEAVLCLATGTVPEVPVPAGVNDDPFCHPDAERRFRLMTDVEELKHALDYPWDRWTVFLHPAQRSTVERDFKGPARVAGSAGTGKTIVALHRAVRLARTIPDGKVLLATFSIPLARNLRAKATRLVGEDSRVWDRLAVRSLDDFALEMYEETFGRAQVPTAAMLESLIRDALRVLPRPMSAAFVASEWFDVVDAWQLDTWEEYRDVPRLGRKTRMGEKQRKLLWPVFEYVRGVLHKRGSVTMANVYSELTQHLQDTGESPVVAVVLDEAQDVSVSQLRFLATLSSARENGLFFAGDLGQRIFQTPFSWASLGVDVRGRSQTLRINYRTSHQIRRQADRLLHPVLSDVDGITESRKGTVSAFNGPNPSIKLAANDMEERELVGAWIQEIIDRGVLPEEIAIFVRSSAQMPRALAMINKAGIEALLLDNDEGLKRGAATVATMHHAKGLEYRAVVVACCDDEIIPLQDRISGVTDDSDLAEVYNTERHLLYVACTRARDFLLITAVEPASEFLDDLAAVSDGVH
ncbi:MAG: 3'-5' exonuclease [Phycisphaerales bacterium]|nr:UvrD-helicase domain-containing protein [Phycisphaerales bacterium]